MKKNLERTMKTLQSSLTLIALMLAGVSLPASAAQVSYALSSLGGTQYRYTYTVTNDGTTGGAIKLFDVFFDPALYDESSLTIVTANPPASDWDQLILASGIAVPAAYDALALSGGIPINGSQAGFAVEFAWLGVGTPGAQDFAIVNPITFDTLETGTTTTSVVPLPAALPLLLTALGGVGVFGRKRSHS